MGIINPAAQRAWLTPESSSNVVAVPLAAAGIGTVRSATHEQSSSPAAHPRSLRLPQASAAVRSGLSAAGRESKAVQSRVQQFVDTGKAHYEATEAQALDAFRAGVRFVTKEHPEASLAGGIAAAALLLPGPRRFLLRNTLGRWAGKGEWRGTEALAAPCPGVCTHARLLCATACPFPRTSSTPPWVLLVPQRRGCVPNRACHAPLLTLVAPAHPTRLPPQVPQRRGHV